MRRISLSLRLCAVFTLPSRSGSSCPTTGFELQVRLHVGAVTHAQQLLQLLVQLLGLGVDALALQLVQRSGRLEQLRFLAFS